MHPVRSLSPKPLLLALSLALVSASAGAWTPLPVADDPLVRMPGTQPDPLLSPEGSANCLGCHDNYDPAVDIGQRWRGSMMAQAARDPLFWAALTVSAQDSIWALGRPNAADLCLRCHTPTGWVGGHSDPSNGAQLSGDDFDGVSCSGCHQLYDPHFEDTFNGVRESSDWLGYWDEAAAASAIGAQETLAADAAEATGVALFNGNAFYDAADQPPAGYSEATAGQLYISSDSRRRASFADTDANHDVLYSRFHKSRYFCGSCHDVSNPALVNLGLDGTPPGDGTTVLPSETQAGHSYGHIERTFSEFMLSDYGIGAGAPGLGPFAPGVFDTSRPGNMIASCQDCHMADTPGRGCNKSDSLLRPAESSEHPQSGQPLHGIAGGNLWIPWLLSSALSNSQSYDATNEALLAQGPALLTLDLNAGVPLDPPALLSSVARAQAMLQAAVAIDELSYDGTTGALSFRVQNQTGHKLISGYPEGRRMFVNIRVFNGTQVIQEINPYDHGVSTLKGLPPSASPMSPPLAASELHDDGLVYEAKLSSSLTGEQHTFHMVLSDDRYKDNRIPPRGFRINEAAARLAQPYDNGLAAPAMYSAAEYMGGYDEVQLNVPASASGVQVRVFYQTTSREYVTFLRDEINGTASTLSSPAPSGEPAAYIAQTDPFFSQLSAWGNTIWQLWDHNRHIPGAAPVLMAEAGVGTVPQTCAVMGSDGAPCDDGDLCTTGETCQAGNCLPGAPVVCVPLGECYDAGSCAAASGLCSTPVKADFTPCMGGVCVGGQCIPDGSGGNGGTGAAGGAGGDGGVQTRAGGNGGVWHGDVPPLPALDNDSGCGCAMAGSATGQGTDWLKLLWLAVLLLSWQRQVCRAEPARS